MSGKFHDISVKFTDGKFNSFWVFVNGGIKGYNKGMKDRSIDEMIADAISESSLPTITPRTDVSREEKDATMAIPQYLIERAASLRQIEEETLKESLTGFRL